MVHLNAALLFLFSILIIIPAVNIFGGKLLSSSPIRSSWVTGPIVCILLVKFTYLKKVKLTYIETVNNLKGNKQADVFFQMN